VQQCTQTCPIELQRTTIRTSREVERSVAASRRLILAGAETHNDFFNAACTAERSSFLTVIEP
jgi:hypothetical protein